SCARQDVKQEASRPQDGQKLRRREQFLCPVCHSDGTCHSPYKITWAQPQRRLPWLPKLRNALRPIPSTKNRATQFSRDACSIGSDGSCNFWGWHFCR